MSPTDREQGELELQLSATLDRSLESLDQMTLAKLAAVRMRAQLRRRRGIQSVVALALAAGLAAIMVMPGLVGTEVDNLDEGLGHLSVDPEMLATMEMLSVLGDPADAG